LDQRFQEIIGHVTVKGQEIPVDNARLTGDQLSFTFRDKADGQNTMMRLKGRIRRDTIQGNVEIQDGPLKGSYPWTATRAYLSLLLPKMLFMQQF
jgi:hypothetical protein